MPTIHLDVNLDTRDEINRAEWDLIQLKSKIAEARRSLPPEPVRDYTLKAQDGSSVRLSELFGDKDDLIVVHNMGKSCPYCTLWADGFVSLLPHLENRAAFVVASPDDPETQRQFAAGRGWAFRMLSGQGSDFTKDMGFEIEGRPQPGVSAFRRREDGSIVRTRYTWLGPGDNFCSAWHFFDLLEKGADGWEPKYSY